MSAIPPNVRHIILVALIVAGFAAKELLTLVPAWHWLITVAQLAAVLGTVFTDAPGTEKRLRAAQSAGGAIALAASDRLHGGKGE